MLTRLADRNAKDDTEKITSAIQKIVQDHVVEIMHGLSANEQDIAARSFQYLVTPSGTKYAYSVADLANLVGCESTALDNLLRKLAKGQRIIRSVGASPDQPDVPRYEIFHDFLATAILEWRRPYLEEKQRKQRRKERILNGLPIAVLAVVFSVGIAGYRRGVEISRLQAAASLQQFETGKQIDALQQAITSGQSVQTWVQNSPFSLLLGSNQKGQVVSQATFSLQQILAMIQERNQFSVPFEQMTSWNFSRDGQTLAIGSADGTIQLWSLSTGNLSNSFKAADKVLDLSFSPDSQSLVAVLVNGAVQRWERQTGKEQTSLQTTHSIQFLRFSPSRPILAIASEDGTVKLWNWQTGSQLPYQLKVSGAVLDLCFSPSGPVLALASGDGTVQLWNWETETDPKQATLKASEAVFHLSFSADGQTLATLSKDGRVQVWKPQKGTQAVTLPTTTLSETVSSLSLNSDGKILATGFTDGTVQLWDWQAGKLQTSFKASDSLAFLRFGPNNQTLITVLSNGRVSVWALPPGNEQAPFQLSGPVLDLSFSPDGRTLTTISPGDTVQLWDWQTGQGSKTLFQPPQQLSAPSFSRDGQTLAGIVGKDYSTIQVWNWKAGGRPVILKASSPVTYLDFSWNGQLLATFSVDGTVQVWDWKTLRSAARFNIPGKVAGISFSSNDQTLAAGLSDGTIQLWNWRSGKQIGKISIPTNAVSSPAFSPDGQTLAIAFNNGTIALMDLQGHPIAQFKSSQPAYSLSFSPDSQTLASGSLGGEVRLWKIESLNGLLTRGCQWLQPYLESHPDKRKELPCSG